MGDKELWYALAQDSSWSLPLHVEWRWHKEADVHYALVMPAVCFYPNQHLLIKAMLDPHDIQGREDQWLIPRTIAESLLHKAPGVTISYYYKWPDPNFPVLPLTKPLSLSPKGAELRNTRSSQDGEAFISHLCQKNGLPNSVVRLVMRAISDDAPRWMLEQRRALDLGFCRLIAAPFRPNWKEIVSFKFRKWKLLGIFNSPQQNKRKALDEAGMPEALCSVQNVGIHRKNHFKINYTLEAIPGRKFDTAVNAVESTRQACGNVSYVASFEKTVESLYHHLLDALETYLRKSGAPFARVSERGNAGLMRFLPTIGAKVRVRGLPVSNLPVHIVAPTTNFSVFGERSDISLVRAKAAKMRQMSSLPPPADDVRKCNGEGSDRLLLRHVGESENEGQPMLSGATPETGDTPGLDGKGDRP